MAAKTRKPMSEYQRGYEAALRKVWRTYTQDTPGCEPAPQDKRFSVWRSWCLPRKWPKP